MGASSRAWIAGGGLPISADWKMAGNGGREVLPQGFLYLFQEACMALDVDAQCPRRSLSYMREAAGSNGSGTCSVLAREHGGCSREWNW